MNDYDQFGLPVERDHLEPITDPEIKHECFRSRRWACLSHIGPDNYGPLIFGTRKAAAGHKAAYPTCFVIEEWDETT